MAIDWTEDQLKAIGSEGDVVVSAGAGSGKTAVLVEKIIRLITQKNVDIDDILIVTFTTAATYDVKEKITEALYREIALAPGDRHLQRQVGKVENASIYTIDAFCGKAVRRHFEKLNVSCNFRVLDENEAQLIKEEILEECIDCEYEEHNDEIFKQLVSQLSERRSDAGLKKAITEINKVLETTADEEYYKKMCIEHFEDGYFVKYATEVLQGLFDIVLSLWGEMDSVCTQLETYEKCKKIIDINVVETEDLKKTLEKDFFEYTRKYSLSSPETLRVGPKWDDEIKRQVKTIKEQMVNVFEVIEEFSAYSEDEYREDCEAQKMLVKRLFEIEERYEQMLWARKTEMGAVSFSDIEKLALNLFVDKTENGLQASESAKEYAEIYKYIFIDEYQDTNELQDTLFSAMSSENNNLFLVGDIKQSIYSFRSACPELFAKKIASDKMNSLVLNANFRSREKIVDAINCLFSRIMTEETGGVAYDDSQKLKFGAQYYKDEDADCELHIVYGKEQDEFEHIADVIKKLITEEHYIQDKKAGKRRIQLRDIAILMRSPRYSSSQLEKVLISNGIPAYSNTRPVFFSNEEIVLATSMLAIIDNPTQDIMLASVLSSAIGGFSNDELAKIRLAKKHCSLYDALKAYSQTDDKAAEFVEKLEGLRILALSTSVAGILTRVYDEFNFLTVAGAMYNGKIRKMNLRLLLEYASQYEKTGFKGIFNFNLYLQKMQENTTEIPGAKAYSDDSDVVRIMSIHSSKGLEFPVVIAAQLDKKYYTRELSGDFIIDRETGIGMRLRDHKKSVKYNTLSLVCARENKRFAMISEELRIWYVALTRAREKLILTTSKTSNEFRKMKKCGEMLDVWGLRYSSSPLDFVINILDAFDSEESQVAEGEVSEVFSVIPWNILHIDPTARLRRENDNAKEETVRFPNKKEVVKNLEFAYPYSVQKGFPSKTSVTAIKKLIEMKKDEPVTTQNLPEYKMQFERPAFITGTGKLTATEKGTALHTFLQYAELSKLSDENDVREEIKRLVENEFITREQADTLDVKSILDFGNSSVLKKALLSGSIERERRFNIKVELGFLAKLTNEQLNSDPSSLVIMQGVIDCLCYDGENYTIIDYKTDRNITENELRDRYSSQMELYKYAVREITGCEHVNCVIYSFYLKKEINV